MRLKALDFQPPALNFSEIHIYRAQDAKQVAVLSGATIKLFALHDD
jgi:hypothetical protein